MSSPNQSGHRVRRRRTELGWTQDELARRAGISRSAVTAVEAERLVPSVEAALGIARALQSTVENLFGPVDPAASAEVWAWPPSTPTVPAWTATVGNRLVRYPASSAPMWTPLPQAETPEAAQDETLVVAGCDPAAGLLASRFAAVTGLRLLAIPCSSRQGLELLRDGLVHMAGLHLATADAPERNSQTAAEVLGSRSASSGLRRGRTASSCPRRRKSAPSRPPWHRSSSGLDGKRAREPANASTGS